MNTFQNTSKPVVIVFSRCGALSMSLVQELVANHCRVIILSDEIESWKNQLGFLSSDTINIYSTQNVLVDSITGNYIVFVSDSVEFPEKLNSKDEVNLLNSITYISKKLSIIALFVFPFKAFPDVSLESQDFLDKIAKRERELTGILYLGDLIGPKINFSEFRILPRIINDIVTGREVRLPTYDADISPVSVYEASRQITRKLFSFGGNGERVALISAPIRLSNLPSYLKRIRKNLQFVYTDENLNFPDISEITHREHLPFNFFEVFKETAEWYVPGFTALESPVNVVVEVPHIAPISKAVVNTMAVPEVRQPMPTPTYYVPREFSTPENLFKPISLPKFMSVNEKPKEKVKQKPEVFMKLRGKAKALQKHKKKIGLAALLALVLLVSPFVLLLTGGVSLVLAKREFVSGNIKSARSISNISGSLFHVSNVELDLLTKIPIFGELFTAPESISRVAYDATKIAKNGFETFTLLSEMSDRILGGDGKDIAYYSRQIGLDLETIYRDLGFLEGELNESTGPVRYFYDKFFKDGEISDIRNKLLSLEDLIKGLPVLLGEKEKKTYLVLFQNNMELRPTGGFIGSYALVSFDKGRLIDIATSDVYDADGQLQGHVEPPVPIKKYLGEANWYMRDSNWDPDFPTSAQRAEWFLDKEVDVDVDGVVGVDLEFAKSLVSLFGKVKLADFDKEITSENLYEISQSEVEEDFFPGSRKKSTYLTSLTRELLNKVTKIKSGDYMNLAKMLFENLDKRHSQVYLHDPSLQKNISALGWDGSISTPTCESGCYPDYVSVVDANVGVNKGNYFIKRSLDLDVDIKSGDILRTLSVTLENNSDTSQKNPIYKSYLRVLVPQLSEVLQTEILHGGTPQTVAPETMTVKGKKEIGVYVEVEPKETARVVFRWRSAASELSGYSLLVRKQAGTVDDPLNVTIQADSGNSNSSLTPSTGTSYTTTLLKDFETKISF